MVLPHCLNYEFQCLRFNKDTEKKKIGEPNISELENHTEIQGEKSKTKSELNSKTLKNGKQGRELQAKDITV